MHIVRMFRSVVLLGGLACFVAAALPGCGDDNPPAGTTVKTDPVADAKRAEKIKEMYKTNPPSKGPGGQAPAAK